MLRWRVCDRLPVNRPERMSAAVGPASASVPVREGGIADLHETVAPSVSGLRPVRRGQRGECLLQATMGRQVRHADPDPSLRNPLETTAPLARAALRVLQGEFSGVGPGSASRRVAARSG